LFLINDFFCICYKQITGLSDAFPQHETSSAVTDAYAWFENCSKQTEWF